MDTPISRWATVREAPKGLYVEGALTSGVAKAEEAARLLRAGGVTGLSVGGTIERDSEKRGLIVIEEFDLREISLVSIPANPAARVSEVRSFASPRDAEAALREAGFSKRDAKALLAHGWQGLKSDLPDPAEAARVLDLINRAADTLKGKRP